MTIGELKYYIKDMDDKLDFMAFDHKTGKYTSFSLVKEDYSLDIEVNILEEEQ
ncbi:hypothetical protein BI001_gp020 [Bacillus phage Zuko]|uniref:hypothetical protein n=1 Tax=Bacillus phage Zuko TaxID=1805956 RepID=UPI0007A76D06|nr:hypothetical protein BI001_gp020 [Bacillus phage Zuko]AMW62623.1 hypothetical protein ZUKO_20 [Bacillus phage Zuko]